MSLLGCKMFEKNDPNLKKSTSPQPQDISSLEPTVLRRLRNALLWVVPATVAIDLGEMIEGHASEQGVFKEFIEEVQNGLIVKVGSSELFGKLISRYVMEILRNSPSAGELVEFADQNKFDLTQAYSTDNLSQETKETYKQRVFQRFMSKIGPHGLKFIQTMQAKDPNGWIAKIITKAQSDLPAPTIAEFELLLKNAFKKQGSLDYVNNFSKYFVVKKILGAGTVGIAALIEYKSSDSAEPKQYVAKIIREGSLDAFRNDFMCFSKAADSLLARGEIPPMVAESFREYNNELYERERLESNPNLEMCHLSQSSYEKKGVCTTVKGYLPLAGKAHGVVFMEKAIGMEFGKYLQIIHNSLAHATTDAEKAEHLEKIATLRKLYAELALLHFSRALDNQSVHADLHPGNLFFDETSNMLSILDLGSMVHPLDPAEHLKLNRFLFALNLSLGTADSNFLRLYYQDEVKTNQKLAMEQIEPMLVSFQEMLDTLRVESAEKNMIDVDVAAAHMMNIIKDSILTVGVHIVPSALFIMAKANTPVNDTLDVLRQSLSSSSYEQSIPYGQRTQFAIALRASFQAQSREKSLWTQEMWDYFSHSILSPRAGFSQLQFEKKFIYGIFGLNDKEAAMADVLIPTAVISAPIALYMAGIYLKKIVNTVSVKLPQMIDSYHVMQKFQQSTQAGAQQLSEFFARYKGYEHLSNLFQKTSKASVPPQLPLAKMTKQNSILGQVKNWFSNLFKVEANSVQPFQKLEISSASSSSSLSALSKKAPYKKNAAHKQVVRKRVEATPAPASVSLPKAAPIKGLPVVQAASVVKSNCKFFLRHSLPAAIVGGLAVEAYHCWKNSEETSGKKGMQP